MSNNLQGAQWAGCRTASGRSAWGRFATRAKVLTATVGVLAAAPGHRPDAPAVVRGPVRLRLYLTGDPSALLAPVAVALAARSASLTDVHIGQPSLEDVFIELTGRGLR